MHGRVVANFGQWLAVRGDDGHIVRCKTHRRTGLIVCGDQVDYRVTTSHDHVVEAILPRQSILARPDRRGQSKPLASNIDQLIIVTAPRPMPDWTMVSAYMIYAHHHRLRSILVLNKSDLLDPQCNEIAEWLDCYAALGYCTLAVCCKSDNGLDTLQTQLAHHTSVLVGQSGVGKSSIVKALLPDRDVQINAISAATGFGSHTTTTTTLYQLPAQGELIDSPGVRQFSVEHLDRESIRHGFIEFAPFVNDCQFSDCSHTHEPGCAILAAIGNGAVSKRRWEHYQELLNRKT